MKLTECEEARFYRGTVLRFGGKYPFTEESTDFMICEYPAADEKHLCLALICVSGYEAGHFEYLFPAEAGSQGTVSVARDWLIENWSKKIYSDCGIEDVEVII